MKRWGRNRRGLSDVVSIVLIVLLVVVALSSIWAFVSSSIRSSGAGLNKAEFCLGNRVEPVSCTVSDGILAGTKKASVVVRRTHVTQEATIQSITSILERGSSGTDESPVPVLPSEGTTATVTHAESSAVPTRVTARTVYQHQSASYTCVSLPLSCSEGAALPPSPGPGPGPGDNPVPSLGSVAPPTGSENIAVTLTLRGTNFVSGSRARWDGVNRVTRFVSSTQLEADIPASEVSVGAHSITVFNPAPGGGTSNSLTFTVAGGGGGGLDPALLASWGLIAYWPFDESGETRTVEDVRSTHEGALSGTIVRVAGKNNNALEFDGSTTIVTVPDSDDFNVQDFTLASWIKTRDAGAGRRRIIYQQNSIFYHLTLFDNNLELGSSFDQPKPSDTFIAPGTAATLTNTAWHHVAVVRRAGSELVLYIDGSVVQRIPITNTNTYAIGSNLFIGAGFGGELSEQFKGSLDEAMFFNKALNEDQIRQIYSSYSA